MSIGTFTVELTVSGQKVETSILHGSPTYHEQELRVKCTVSALDLNSAARAALKSLGDLVRQNED